MPRLLAAATLLLPLLLAGCGEPGGPPLVSGQTPPGVGLVNANYEPQPINSLPPGAAGRPRNNPFATAPDYLSYTFGR